MPKHRQMGPMGDWTHKEFIEWHIKRANDELIGRAKWVSERALELQQRAEDPDGYMSSNGTIQNLALETDALEVKLAILLEVQAYLNRCDLCQAEGHAWRNCDKFDVQVRPK